MVDKSKGISAQFILKGTTINLNVFIANVEMSVNYEGGYSRSPAEQDILVSNLLVV